MINEIIVLLGRVESEKEQSYIKYDCIFPLKKLTKV